MRPVNLLPAADRPRMATGKRQGSSYYLLGGLGALLLAVLVLVFFGNQATSKENEAARLNEESRRAEARAGGLGPFAAFSEVKTTRVQSVKELAQGRFDFERLARELARVLPDDVFLTSLEAAGQTEETPGAGAAGAASAPELKLAGCAPAHQDVARTLVRLRRLHRVEQVKLERSSRPTDSGGGSGQEQQGEGVSGCEELAGGRRLSEFAVVATFAAGGPQPTEQESVPASLGGGS